MSVYLYLLTNGWPSKLSPGLIGAVCVLQLLTLFCCGTDGDKEAKLEYTKVEGEIQLEKKEFIPLLDLDIQQTNKLHFGE